MEKIIASEIVPNGLDSELLDLIEANVTKLKLEESILYYGFPVFKDFDNNSIKSKFCLLSKHHGLIVLDSANQNNINERDLELSQLFSILESTLKKSKKLRVKKRDLAINIESYIYINSNNFDPASLENECITSYKGLIEEIESIECKKIDDELFDECRSIIEGAKALTKYSKRVKQSDDPTSKLNILIALEDEIQNFDEDQRKIAISLINGPQRIRGLAGSGKTVVLAMKAAHIHLQHPDKKILFTFYTKSIYGLIRNSISNFYRHFSGHEPNWDNIDVLHSWGGKSIDGVYYNACAENSLLSMSFDQGKSLNPNDPFSAVCKHISNRDISQKYDYILIDEAQDLPNEFFHICYKLAIGESGESKNIVWAYDDLQSIFNVYQRTPTELFGKHDNGSAKVDLEKFKLNLKFAQSNDLVLYKCYRNPLEVLVTAHALGFGIYSDRPVQMLENREHWEDVGYNIEENDELKVGLKTIIKRDVSNSPLSIYQYQKKTDIIQYKCCNDFEQECSWIAENITSLISEGIKQHDILVICLDDRNAKRYFSRISTLLSMKSIRSNNLLIASSAAPPFLLDEMVTLSTVHRAKGNEAAVVFCAGIDALYFHRNTRSGRNKIFTAFTRTKAWLKVSGIGEYANYFFREIDQSIQNSPSLIFTVPDKNEIETIQRDLNDKPQELRKLQLLYGELLTKGYTEEQIQMELELAKGGDNLAR